MICGECAYILDRQRGGMVCAVHYRDQGEDDAAIDLAIALQRYEIDLQLALRAIKKNLGREGKCLPQANAHLLANACPSPIEQGERSQDEPHKLCLADSTPAPAPNPNAAAFDQVHVFKGGRW